MSENSTGAFDLLEAAATGNTQRVQALLDGGADPNVRDVLDGMTPLHLAAEHGCTDVARVLIDRGASVSASENDTGSSPLGIALIAGQLELAQMILNHGGRLTSLEIKTGILDEARSLGYHSIVEAIEEAQL